MRAVLHPPGTAVRFSATEQEPPGRWCDEIFLFPASPVWGLCSVRQDGDHYRHRSPEPSQTFPLSKQPRCHICPPSCPQTRRFWDSPISQNLMADPQSRPGELESSLGTDLQPGLHLRLHIFIFLRFPQSSHRLGLAVLLGSLLLFAPLLNLLYSPNIFLLVVLGLFPCTARGDTAFTPPRDAGSCSTGTERLLLWLSCSGSHQAGRGAMPAHRVTQMSPSAQPRLLPGPLAVLWVTSLEKGTSFTKMFSVSTCTGNLPKPCLASVSSSSPN